MSDYIKREDVLNCFSTAFWSGLAAKIKEIPPADVAPVRHGRWKEHQGYCECDQCECLVTSDFKYCPNCGARMDAKK